MRSSMFAVLALFIFASPGRAQTGLAVAMAEKEGAALAARIVKKKLHAFKEKLAGKCTFENPCGYIGTDGKIKIKPIFSAVTPFNEGHAAVKLVDKWGLIDKTGRYVISPEYEEMGECSEGLVAAKKNGLWMFLDKNGKQKVDLPFPEVRKFSEGLAAVQVDGKWGYIDKSGRFAIKPRYAAAGDFSDGVAPVQAEKSWGYINRSGDLKIEPQFDAAQSFSEGMASVQLDTKWGFIGKNGRIVINPQFTASRSFHEGLAAVKDASGLWGYVDAKGRQKIKPAFADAADFSGGLARVETKDKEFYVNKQGKDAGVASEPAGSPAPEGCRHCDKFKMQASFEAAGKNGMLANEAVAALKRAVGGRGDGFEAMAGVAKGKDAGWRATFDSAMDNVSDGKPLTDKQGAVLKDLAESVAAH